MPSTIHIDIDPFLKEWLGKKGKQVGLSKNAMVKLLLTAAWKRDESISDRVILKALEGKRIRRRA